MDSNSELTTSTEQQIKVIIQQQDFVLADEVDWLEQQNLEDGATVTFCGRVRQNNLANRVTGLTIEHYPGMTEKTIKDIIIQAQLRWHINRVSVIHRIGKLRVGEQIVFVGTTSLHRQDAYAANEFIMDFLKVNAPFWKKETTQQGETWLDAKQSDNIKAKHWKSD
jgi:molybdopterin synthase catalytic subunit